MKLEFEWDEGKVRDNYKKHRVRFELAVKVFGDVFAVEFVDDRREYPEERFIILGVAASDFLYVAYSERQDRIRLISARRMTKNEQKYYFEQNSEAGDFRSN